MKTLTQGKGEDTALWWHSQCLDKQGRMWKYGRAWLHWPRNSAGFSWLLFGRSCGVSIDCSDTGDDNLTLHLALPFLFSVWLHISRLPIVKRLPGVKWNGKWGSGDREIRIAFHDGAVWWQLWRYPNESKPNDWRDSNFDFVDFLLGRNKYSESERTKDNVFIEMPEGYYPASVELYTATWKRSRWPWPKIVQRAEIEIEGGLPIPGKGENGYDCEDDAIFSGNYCAVTVWEATASIRASALRDRQRYGGDGWAPDDGWPDHCIARGVSGD